MKEVRVPAVSGYFYPSDINQLKTLIESYIRKAKDIPEDILGKEINGIISPHAGYIYSGWVAGYAYRTIYGKKYDTVILLGPSHEYAFEGVALAPYKYFATPLGKVEVNLNISQKLKEKEPDYFIFSEKPHIPEHCLEVQLPFLQVSLKEGFTIVPMLIGTFRKKILETIANTILDTISSDIEDTLILVSTDLSHYYPVEINLKMDGVVIEKLEAMDIDGLYSSFVDGDAEACGASALIVSMIIFKTLQKNVKVLKHANSSVVSGDTNQVVGYLSAVYYS